MTLSGKVVETWDHRSCCRDIQCRRSKSNKTKATIAIPLLILNHLYKRRILKRYMVHMFIASLSIIAKCESNPSVCGAWTHNELLALKRKEGVDSFIL